MAIPPKLSTAWSTRLALEVSGERVPGLHVPPRTPKKLPVPPETTSQDANTPLPVLATNATSEGRSV